MTWDIAQILDREMKIIKEHGKLLLLTEKRITRMSLHDTFAKIQSNWDISIDDLSESDLLALIEFKEKGTPGNKLVERFKTGDTALLNRIIRHHGFVNYIESLLFGGNNV